MAKDTDQCVDIIHHLTRIQGQLDALKGYLAEKRSCTDVAHLTHSILTSFQSARASILEEMLHKEFTSAWKAKDVEKLQSMVAMYKA